jgi:uncharacterized membrane protein YeaQ/YmgE (transglycosylase-associated protein family)
MDSVMAFITDNPALVIMLVNGLIAGWLAGLLLGGGGLIRNLIVGIIGAVLGGWMLTQGILTLPFNFDSLIPYGNQIAVSTIGAMIVVLLARFLGGR